MKRLPALDGLRGVAIVSVVAAHFGVPYTLGGGGTGVLIFFVLSGYLITTLLIGERLRTGRIDVLAFYGRRARRLLPALAAVLIATLAAGTLLGQLDTVVPQAIRAALYHANLVQATEPLGHAWTLSVEEQFYVVWPALVILADAALALPFVLLLLAPLEIAAFGAIAAGAVLAWARPTPLAAWLAVPAAAVLLLATMVPYGPHDFVPVRLAVVAASLVLVRVALAPIPVLSLRPLRYLGRISYGIYLWHIPVRWMLAEIGVDATWSPGMALGMALTFGIAAVSWRYLERPLLTRRHADNDRAFPRHAGSTVAPSSTDSP